MAFGTPKVVRFLLPLESNFLVVVFVRLRVVFEILAAASLSRSRQNECDLE